MAQIHELIPKVMADVVAVEKDRKNPQQGYQFRGIDDVYNALHGPLSRHGIFVVPSVQSQVREERQTKNGGNLIYTLLTVKFAFFAPDGSSVEAVTVGEAMDSGDKSANKAMSAAMKYVMLMVFSIPTEDQKDTETETHEIVPRQPPPVQQPVAPSVYQTPEGRRLTETLKSLGCKTPEDGTACVVYACICCEIPEPASKEERYQRADEIDKAIHATIDKIAGGEQVSLEDAMVKVLQYGREELAARNEESK